MYLKTLHSIHKWIGPCVWDSIWSSNCTASQMDQIGTCETIQEFKLPPHLLLQLTLHNSHLRTLPTGGLRRLRSLGYWALHSPVKIPFLNVALHFSHLECSPTSFPFTYFLSILQVPVPLLKLSLLAWVTNRNYWNNYHIVWALIFLKLICWALLTDQADDSPFCDYISISLYLYWNMSLPGQNLSHPLSTIFPSTIF